MFIAYFIFLNLPIWANFVDPIDLSLYYYYQPLDQPTLFYSLNQVNKLRTRLDRQHRWRTVAA